ncbi:hypothetical protein [Dactylosporangium sp. CA-139066]|uniref:hypothetical protein n=1 Tax=Dactylosporangium sp. CA-139066 TaxID=3239930 RepID=UPI003D950004
MMIMGSHAKRDNGIEDEADAAAEPQPMLNVRPPGPPGSAASYTLHSVAVCWVLAGIVVALGRSTGSGDSGSGSYSTSTQTALDDAVDAAKTAQTLQLVLLCLLAATSVLPLGRSSVRSAGRSKRGLEHGHRLPRFLLASGW